MSHSTSTQKSVAEGARLAEKPRNVGGRPEGTCGLPTTVENVAIDAGLAIDSLQASLLTIFSLLADDAESVAGLVSDEAARLAATVPPDQLGQRLAQLAREGTRVSFARMYRRLVDLRPEVAARFERIRRDLGAAA